MVQEEYNKGFLLSSTERGRTRDADAGYRARGSMDDGQPPDAVAKHFFEVDMTAERRSGDRLTRCIRPSFREEPEVIAGRKLRDRSMEVYDDNPA
jgi:hypothetical protein